jgi:hypothetical protein
LRLLRLHGLIADHPLFVFPETGEALLQAEVFAYDDGCLAAAIFVERLRVEGNRGG